MTDTTHLESILEEISLELVLADMGEPDSFSSLLPLLKSFFQTAKSSKHDELAEDAKRAGKLVKNILDQTDAASNEPVESLNLIISEMKSFLHLIIREADNIPAKSVPPAEFNAKMDDREHISGKHDRETETDDNGITPLPHQLGEIKKITSNNEPVDKKAAPSSPAPLHPDTLPAYLNIDDFSEFLTLQADSLAKIETLLLDAEKFDNPKAVQDELKRLFHTTKGEAGFLGLKDVEQVCHKAEDLINNDQFRLYIDTLLSVKDWLEATYATYAGQKPSTPPDAVKRILAILDKTAAPLSLANTENETTISFQDVTSRTAEPPSENSSPSQSIPEMSKRSKMTESMHVDAQRLDRLVEMIGEISIAESMITQSPELKHNASTDLLRAMNTLHKTTRELQSLALSLRMVPLKPMFQRMERVVRDLAKKTDKRIHFKMNGEGTELDKKLVNHLSDPLIHLIRNAVDHGIESNSQERLEMGKSEVATIALNAFQKGGFLYIEISDDGKGIDRQRLAEKAKVIGLLSKDFTHSHSSSEDLLNLIFHPGLSTAKTVTGISGRGVGMDVVKKSIDTCKGKISIESTEGVGTTCTIKLPLTLSIIDGLVVRVAQEQYVIPTLSIVTSLKVEKSAVSNVFENREMLDALGSLMPLFRLSQLFNLNGQTAAHPWEGIVVVVEDSGHRTALLADELLGKQNTVIKSLGDGMEDIKGVSGATIMPDGKVSLILDIGGIVEISHKETKRYGQ